jgi:hypothetical protein
MIKNDSMHKKLYHYALVFLSLFCTGCKEDIHDPANFEYPPVPPIWIVEDDPKQTIFSRDEKDLERDRQVGKMMVIPLYQYYEHNGATEFLAIAHPFVYEQGQDIENRLSSFEQRENLRRLIFWVPGYFPDGLGRSYWWQPTIKGKKMIVQELQPCVGLERDELNSAMKALLLDGDFEVGKKIFLKVPPMHHDERNFLGELRTAIEPYNADLVVRTMEYNGRFYDDGGVLNMHVLWGFPPGTKIVNRLSDEDKKTVAAFADEVMKKAKEESPKNENKDKSDRTSAG